MISPEKLLVLLALIVMISGLGCTAIVNRMRVAERRRFRHRGYSGRRPWYARL